MPLDERYKQVQFVLVQVRKVESSNVRRLAAHRAYIVTILLDFKEFLVLSLAFPDAGNPLDRQEKVNYLEFL